MTTMTVTEEVIQEAITSGEMYGSPDCSREVYKVGDLVVKIGGYPANEMANYQRVSAILAKCDTYDGITFGLPHMSMLTIPHVGKVMVCELIVGPENPEGCPDFFGECLCEICPGKVDAIARREFDLLDIHYANYIVRDGVVYMIDLEG